MKPQKLPLAPLPKLRQAAPKLPTGRTSFRGDQEGAFREQRRLARARRTGKGAIIPGPTTLGALYRSHL